MRVAAIASEEPEEMPRTKGSARGLRKRVWRTAPAAPSEAPETRAAKVLTSLRSMTVAARPSALNPKRAPSTDSKGTLTEPVAVESRIDPKRETGRKGMTDRLMPQSATK